MRTELQFPIKLDGRHFGDHKYDYYAWMRDNAPVYKARVSVLNFHLITRYQDCVETLADRQLFRNRGTAVGGGRFPFPIPKSASFLVETMLDEDDPKHRRLRGLVQSGFTPRALAKLEERVERLSHELLDSARNEGTIDLQSAYSQPIPVTVISEIMGVRGDEMPRFMKSVETLTAGLSGWRLLRTLLFGLRGTAAHVRELIAEKRSNPRDDILTRLVQAEEDGDQLTDDELVSMVFLLIFAGSESTTHLITNGVLALLQHPEQLQLLREQPELIGPAVEEMLRYRGPVQGTKPGFVRDPFELHGVTIPRGAAVMPMVAAANHDPTGFQNPEVFDSTRSPNRHVGFGHGIHFCLGAQLGRMEARIAIGNLVRRSPNLALAVDASKLRLQQTPGWHRYEALPVRV